MNQTHIILILAALMLGGVAVFMSQSMMEDNPTVPTAVSTAQLESIASHLESMDERMVKMEQRLDSVSNRPSGSGVDRSLDADSVNRMIAQALQDHGSMMVEEGMADGASEEEIAQKRAQFLDHSIAKFLDPNFTSDDREALWDQLKEQGLIEEAIVMLEQEVKGNPDNVNLMNQLAYAYIQPIMRGGVGGMDAGKWSMKADGMYDSVLALDDHNWEARFSKAISYSFWPPMFGKQPEAIRHFEILVGQQANQTATAQFSQTHLLLGNLYEQQGDHEKAMAAWQVGYDRFPDDSDLRKQLGIE